MQQAVTEAKAATARTRNRLLPLVSRTFALTIPQLPRPLSEIVGNAYLLCRLADTIEDDPELPPDAKAAYMRQLIDAVDGSGDAARFATNLYPRLSSRTPAGERELVREAPAVISEARGFSDAQRTAVARCVGTMCEGMPEFQEQRSLDGLATLPDMDRYCYFVAGVVGEMLTDLFCDYSPRIMARRDELMSLSVCFGQGLQMTNILKDVWEDRRAQICWLPRSAFAGIPGGLGAAMRRGDHAALAGGIEELVGVAHAHLVSALRYTLLIPRREGGIRRFCLWAIGLALLTLRRIHATPGYSSAREVKIGRRSVKGVMLACSLARGSDGTLQRLFRAAARGLPCADPAALCPPAGARLASDRLG